MRVVSDQLIHFRTVVVGSGHHESSNRAISHQFRPQVLCSLLVRIVG